MAEERIPTHRMARTTIRHGRRKSPTAVGGEIGGLRGSLVLAARSMLATLNAKSQAPIYKKPLKIAKPGSLNDLRGVAEGQKQVWRKLRPPGVTARLGSRIRLTVVSPPRPRPANARDVVTKAVID